MSFQSVIDNAANMTITRRPTVASTTSRSGVVRSVSQGNALWRIEVGLPDGVRWTDYRTIINGFETLDRFTNDTVNFANSGYSWMFPYQGDEPNIGNLRVNVINDALQIATGVTITSGYVFRAGDMISLSGGRLYQVTEDVAWDETLIPTHRPVVDEAVGTYDTLVGPLAEITIICVQMPNWSFAERNQVSWNGTFIFQEVL
jgi:hypothetical protein